MQNLVVDTNSLIQIISPRSPYRPIYDSLIDGTYALCVTTEILEEYEEIFLRFMRPQSARMIMDAIVGNPHTRRITSYYHFNLIASDPDDNKFVDCAIAANAKYIVTEDHHYDILKQIDFPHVDIIRLDDMMKEIL